jgi:GABA(A) receptor-associated protein
MKSFRDKPLQERKQSVDIIFRKYPDRIPVCIYKNKGSKTPDIDKEKYLVPGDLTVGQFLYVIRKRIKLKPEEALYIYFNGNLVNTGVTIKEVYHTHKDKDDEMLYALYATENTFG